MTAIDCRTTWGELIALEPGLASLATEAQRMRGGRRGSPDWREWADIKRRLAVLVGWECRRNVARLQSSAAYDAAYDRLLASWEGWR